MTMFPEIEGQLVQAAEQQRARRRHARGRRVITVAIAAAIAIPSTAVGINTLVSRDEVGQGPVSAENQTAGTYSVLAVTRGDAACLAIQLRDARQPEGRAPTCEPQPITTPLHNVTVSIVGAGNQRLIAGIVSADVATVDAVGVERPITLLRLKDHPGAYFDVLMNQAGPAVLTARDRTGKVLATLDTSDYGPVGRGDFNGK